MSLSEHEAYTVGLSGLNGLMGLGLKNLCKNWSVCYYWQFRMKRILKNLVATKWFYHNNNIIVIIGIKAPTARFMI